MAQFYVKTKCKSSGISIRLAVCGARFEAVKVAQMLSWDKEVEVENERKQVVYRFSQGKEMAVSDLRKLIRPKILGSGF